MKRPSADTLPATEVAGGRDVLRDDDLQDVGAGRLVRARWLTQADAVLVEMSSRGGLSPLDARARDLIRRMVADVRDDGWATGEVGRVP